MKRIKRIAFFITAMCMLFCLVLSSTDWVIKEEVADVKKISVCVALEERPGLESLKRGILETAGESRVDVNYVALPQEEITFSQISREYEGGAQAVIMLADQQQAVREYLSGERREGLMVTTNLFGGEKGVPDISFDIQGAVQELAGMIQKVHGAAGHVILLTGDGGISKEAETKLKEQCRQKGIKAVCVEGTKENILQCRESKKDTVYVGCWITETEEAAEWLKGETLYGIGFSERILDKMKEGRIAGVEAFNMYAMGVGATRQAIAVIEGGCAKDIQIPGRLVTKENLEAEEEFLVPIH
ncbi:MAG: hypothetical protein HFI06_10715 [Eubacterium sp.]|jgi:hypothetical protein|nr:hypothetical protein [Eubacterium sp.]NBI86401.1 hypothetical protein [Lachnospiraceae bacterium]